MKNNIAHDDLKRNGLITLRDFEGVWKIKSTVLKYPHIQITRYDIQGNSRRDYEMVTVDKIDEVVSDNVYEYETIDDINVLVIM